MYFNALRSISEHRTGFLCAVLKSTLENTAAGGADMQRNPSVYDEVHRYATESDGMR